MYQQTMLVQIRKAWAAHVELTLAEPHALVQAISKVAIKEIETQDPPDKAKQIYACTHKLKHWWEFFESHYVFFMKLVFIEIVKVRCTHIETKAINIHFNGHLFSS